MFGMVRTLITGASVGVMLLASELISFTTWTNQPGENFVRVEPPLPITGASAGDMKAVPGRGDEWAVQILARPLFASTRRPAPPVAGSSVGRTTPRLAGVVSWPDGKFALFSSRQKPGVVAVGEGASLEGWTIQKIGAEGVIVRHGEERQILHPAFAEPDNDSKRVPVRVMERARDPSGHHFSPPSYLQRRASDG